MEGEGEVSTRGEDGGEDGEEHEREHRKGHGGNTKGRLRRA